MSWVSLVLERVTTPAAVSFLCAFYRLIAPGNTAGGNAVSDHPNIAMWQEPKQVILLFISSPW
eukprot:5411105-Amphidinium_carterae.1